MNCNNHPEKEAKHYCNGCHGLFCEVCVQSFNAGEFTTYMCPTCGGPCEEVDPEKDYSSSPGTGEGSGRRKVKIDEEALKKRAPDISLKESAEKKEEPKVQEQPASEETLEDSAFDDVGQGEVDGGMGFPSFDESSTSTGHQENALPPMPEMVDEGHQELPPLPTEEEFPSPMPEVANEEHQELPPIPTEEESSSPVSEMVDEEHQELPPIPVEDEPKEEKATVSPSVEASSQSDEKLGGFESVETEPLLVNSEEDDFDDLQMAGLANLAPLSQDDTPSKVSSEQDLDSNTPSPLAPSNEGVSMLRNEALDQVGLGEVIQDEDEIDDDLESIDEKDPSDQSGEGPALSFVTSIKGALFTPGEHFLETYKAMSFRLDMRKKWIIFVSVLVVLFLGLKFLTPSTNGSSIGGVNLILSALLGILVFPLALTFGVRPFSQKVNHIPSLFIVFCGVHAFYECLKVGIVFAGLFFLDALFLLPLGLVVLLIEAWILYRNLVKGFSCPPLQSTLVLGMAYLLSWAVALYLLKSAYSI